MAPFNSNYVSFRSILGPNDRLWFLHLPAKFSSGVIYGDFEKMCYFLTTFGPDKRIPVSLFGTLWIAVSSRFLKNNNMLPFFTYFGIPQGSVHFDDSAEIVTVTQDREVTGKNEN